MNQKQRQMLYKHSSGRYFSTSRRSNYNTSRYAYSKDLEAEVETCVS